MRETAAIKLDPPLPFGVPNATVRLRPLVTGEMLTPPGYADDAHRGIGGRWRAKDEQPWIPLQVYVVEHPSAGLILVDTGPPAAAAHDPRAAFGRLGAMVYNIRTRPDQISAAQLRADGTDPSEVAIVILTHLHVPQVGAVSEFPNSSFVVDNREWTAAQHRGAFKNGYIPRFIAHAFDWRLADFDASNIDSFATFGRSIDLLGDGSVTLVSTPGHSVGHMSVVLRLGKREALICGDAAMTRASIDDGTVPASTQDEHNFKRSLREIRAYTQMTPSALVIPGHDPESFARLESAYS